jgi:hypothetical protein
MSPVRRTASLPTMSLVLNARGGPLERGYGFGVARQLFEAAVAGGLAMLEQAASLLQASAVRL